MCRRYAFLVIKETLYQEVLIVQLYYEILEINLRELLLENMIAMCSLCVFQELAEL